MNRGVTFNDSDEQVSWQSIISRVKTSKTDILSPSPSLWWKYDSKYQVLNLFTVENVLDKLVAPSFMFFLSVPKKSQKLKVPVSTTEAPSPVSG